jgi:hypothetical protein
MREVVSVLKVVRRLGDVWGMEKENPAELP